MGTYTLTKKPVTACMDDLSIDLGLLRLEDEELYSLQRRLLLEAREPSGSTQIDFIKSLSRRVGLFDVPVFDINLKLVNNVPVAEDPYIEITSGYMRLYSDYANNVIDVEINLHNKSDGYFLTDVYDAISPSIYFSIEILDGNYEYRQSKYLRYDNNERYIVSEVLTGTVVSKLNHNNIVSIAPQNSASFVNEQEALEDLANNGDYFVDYAGGVLFSYLTHGGLISYTYREFPYRVVWQAVHSYPYSDPDKKVFHKDTLISDVDGSSEHSLLNDVGAKIANDILALHPLTYGV